MQTVVPPPETARPAAAGHRIFRRAMIGLAMLAISTGASAWLLHAGIDPVEEREAAYRPPVRHELLADVKSWRRAFDTHAVDTAAAAADDLAVVHPASLGGSQDEQRARLAAFKKKPDGTRRLVLATVSMGRTDTTAAYWNAAWSKPGQQAARTGPSDVVLFGATPANAAPPLAARQAAGGDLPAWLGPEDGAARGTYTVRYWDPEWKALLFGHEDSEIERLLGLGFDGVVLADVDGHRAWASQRPDAMQRMIELIGAAVAHAKVRNPDAIVALQNGEELLDSRTIRSAIDLVVKEELLYGNDGLDRPRLTREISEGLSRLRKAHAEGVPVFVVERLASEPARIAARRTIESYMFVPDVAAGPRSTSR